MDCTALLKRSEQQLLAGNVTTADAAVELVDCFPEVCEKVFGSGDFDLAGTGVFVSTVIQVALFVLFGTAQAYISQCISARASTKTKLAIARFQSVNDTVYSTGAFFSLALLIITYVRTGQDGVSGLEKSIMQDVIDCHHMLQNLAMATYWIQKTPSNIKRSARSWGDGSVYLVSQGIGLLAWTVKRRLDQIPSTGAEVAPRLCSSLYDYPHLHTGQAAPGYNPFLVGTGLGLLMILAGVFLAVTLPRLWSWMKKAFESRAFLATCAISFTLLCLLCVSFETIHLYLSRKDLEELPQWDLAQTFALLLWLQPAGHIVLAALVSLGAGKVRSAEESSKMKLVVEATIGMLYSSCFEAPSVDESGDESAKVLAEKPSQARSDASPPAAEEYDEKARLIDDTASPNHDHPRSPSPGGLV